MTCNKVWDLVGNTALVEISSLSKRTGCRILAKCEFLNPGGSIKDRAAKAIIADAEARGLLKPGQAIVEGTAGNTGIGLATLAAERGYRVIVTVPDNQAAEKYLLLEALGAEVRKFKPVPFANQDHFYHQARRIAEQDAANYFWANQFENTANQEAHFRTTGPEIWNQTMGAVDAFVCSVGSGGTIAGVSRALKERNPKVHIALIDPFGSGLFKYVTTGKFEAEGSSVTEGIGIMRLTANFQQALVDEAMRATDQEMIDMLFHVARYDGLFVGTSAALNLFAAYQLGLRHKGSGKTIVTMICDLGTRYQSKLLSSEWQREKGLVPKSLA
jgi:cysteine synthase